MKAPFVNLCQCSWLGSLSNLCTPWSIESGLLGTGRWITARAVVPESGHLGVGSLIRPLVGVVVRDRKGEAMILSHLLILLMTSSYKFLLSPLPVPRHQPWSHILSCSPFLSPPLHSFISSYIGNLSFTLPSILLHVYVSFSLLLFPFSITHCANPLVLDLEFWGLAFAFPSFESFHFPDQHFPSTPHLHHSFPLCPPNH